MNTLGNASLKGQTILFSAFISPCFSNERAVGHSVISTQVPLYVLVVQGLLDVSPSEMID